MRLSWASRWSRSHEHSIQASWGIRSPPRSRGDGTPHGHTVLAAYPRSSWATARKRLYWQRYRSRSPLDDAECHFKKKNVQCQPMVEFSLFLNSTIRMARRANTRVLEVKHPGIECRGL